MNDVDEPMCENSDDDLGIHDSDDETRYITQARTHKNTCKMAIVYMKLEKNYRCRSEFCPPVNSVPPDTIHR